MHALVFAASQNAENNIVGVTLKLLHAWKDGKQIKIPNDFRNDFLRT